MVFLIVMPRCHEESGDPHEFFSPQPHNNEAQAVIVESCVRKRCNPVGRACLGTAWETHENKTQTAPTKNTQNKKDLPSAHHHEQIHPSLYRCRSRCRFPLSGVFGAGKTRSAENSVSSRMHYTRRERSQILSTVCFLAAACKLHHRRSAGGVVFFPALPGEYETWSVNYWNFE